MEQADDRRKQAWHLDKTISISHLLATGSVTIGLITWGMSMATRVSVLEAEIAHSQANDARIESQLKESVGRIEAAVIRIEAALREKQDKRR